MEYKSIEGKFYYTDDYFNKLTGNDKNSHLRTMAMNITLATTPAIDKSDKTSNIKNLLSNIGFSDITTYDYNSNNSNSIGTVIAHKKVNDYEVIILSLRGIKYEKEWASNFKANENGNIKGFEEARDIVLNRLKEYISLKKINSKIKILITGYSRAGAISNLVGVYLNENLSLFNLKSDNDIYIYTFEAPNSSNSTKEYKNIHNIVNKNDIITYVYPKEWKIQNNGLIEEISDNDISLEKYTLNYTNIIGGDSLLKKSTEKIDADKFLEELMKWLSSNGLSRETYNKTIGKYLPSLIEMLYSKNYNEQIKIIEFFQNDFLSAAKSNTSDLYMMLLSFINSKELSNKDIGNISQNIKTWLDKAKKSNKTVPLTDKEYNNIRNMLSDYESIKLMHKLIYSSYHEKPTAYHLATLIANIDVLIKEHYPEKNYELIKNLDSFYN